MPVNSSMPIIACKRDNKIILAQILGSLSQNAYLCNVIINLKRLRLCLYHVCVVDDNSRRIGPGGYATNAVIAYAPRVSPVLNALSALGAFLIQPY